MAASGDVTVSQDGAQGNVKLHPYLITLVRWCVSCVWSTATVILHRLMITPLQPITGPRPPTRSKVPKRAAGTEHLHPESTVECQLLHTPTSHTMDVIFVHGLYGSLANTWKQGEWRQKYKDSPKKVPLRNHSTPSCGCRPNSDNLIYNNNKCNDADLNESDISITKLNEKLSKKIIPEENELITEQFYNNTLLDQIEIIDNYDTQAKFVSDLFKKENCDTNCDSKNPNKCTYNHDNYNKNKSVNTNTSNKTICNFDKINDNICNLEQINDNICNFEQINENKCDKNDKIHEFDECKCVFNENKCKLEKKCEPGCGCICNDCYSTCWPRDWISKDYPGARVISINYTSDPYLWRPLWIKENKRLNLYQRSEQMIEQLLALRVGEKPIIWVGHSKGGLFIKQIFCEAHEAYMKTNNISKEYNKIPEEMNKNETTINNGITSENIDAIIKHFTHSDEDERNVIENNDKYMINNDNYIRNNDNDYTNNDNDIINDDNHLKNSDKGILDRDNEYNNICENNNKECNDRMINNNIRNSDNKNSDIANKNSGTEIHLNVLQINENAKIDNKVNELNNDSKCNANAISENLDRIEIRKESEENSSMIEERLSSLYVNSRGFMFYSVPHRGSPLADIKTPLTARSVDLLEIAKDCPLVVSLQSRWLQAISRVSSRVRVRSVMESCRTLMSVLWLRIVSAESADAGIGSLCGVNVDHREICKPSSRACLLYTELTGLIDDVITCKCP